MHNLCRIAHERSAKEPVGARFNAKKEVIRIGDSVQVIVLAVNGQKVRLGIVAPQDVIVDREEVSERKRRERDSQAQ